MVNPRAGPPFVITLVVRTATRFPLRARTRDHRRPTLRRTHRQARHSERKCREGARLAEGLYAK